MANIPVQTTSASYNVLTGDGLLRSLLPRTVRALGRKPQRIFVLTSPEIWALWSKSFLASFQKDAPAVLFLPAGETHKHMRSVEALARQLAQAGADRSSLLIAFGGGIVGDLGGFLAAIYMRGIDYIQVPTTLLAQVDSSIGGKTGANLPEGKNLVGCFYQPRAVFADVAPLQTLPERELRAGLFESIKAGIIRDARLFTYLERNSAAVLGRDPKALEHVIAASIRMKAAVVSEDERESGVRMHLNLGHTLGHALEAATSYRKFLHGEAVGLGMIAAVEIGLERKTLTAAQAERITRLIDLYGPFPHASLSPEKLLAASSRDKKHSAGIRRFVLPVGIGNAVVVEDVTTGELTRAAEAMLRKRKTP
ncbi:MAG TPA: 3-dehydroquinate synthase [Acidisarcina sp.]|nr:3-dehydroquinate synthase [Acidisarcina sp.]